MKVILIIDIKEDADIKTLRANFEVYGDIRIKPYYQSNYQFGEGVKLKPMPSKKVPIFDPNSASYNEEYEKRIMYEIDGYNRCIDEILGETKSDLSTDEGWWRDYELYEMQND